MLSKSQISFIRSLHQKKFRKENGLFLVEGLKSITEFIASSYVIDTLYIRDTTAAKVLKIPHKINVTEISQADLHRISALQTPQDALAVVRIPEKTGVKTASPTDTIVLVLDGVQDPGNLGTIIRTADWFGFTQIICSNDTVEAWNPKTVQASMGSLARVDISYTDLPLLLAETTRPVFGTLLDGRSVFETDWPAAAWLVLGSEGKGISPAVQAHISDAVTIPRFGKAESLNVAVAASICCAEIRRSGRK